MTSLDSIFKTRDILPIKVRLVKAMVSPVDQVLSELCPYIVKAMVFPVVMYECERWTIKKAECRRIDAFEL